MYLYNELPDIKTFSGFFTAYEDRNYSYYKNFVLHSSLFFSDNEKVMFFTKTKLCSLQKFSMQNGCFFECFYVIFT